MDRVSQLEKMKEAQKRKEQALQKISDEQYSRDEAERIIKDIIKDEEVSRKVQKETKDKCEIM